MNDHNTTPYFPDNLQDYPAWVAQYGLLYPFDECQCGCGEPAPLATNTSQERGRTEGQSQRFISHHNQRKHYDFEGPNPSGLCMCGCGQPTRLAKQTAPSLGLLKGQPNRFISQHFSRLPHKNPHIRKAPPIEDRFWPNVDKRGPNECWLWTGALNGDGYGLISMNNKLYRATRIGYELCIGPIPDDQKVCHSCDNPPCCNPAHWFLGTQAENVADMISKGRGFWQKRKPG